MKSPKLTFIILVLIFLLPLFSAKYFFSDYQQKDIFKTTNYGKLLNPPLKLADWINPAEKSRYEGRWVLIYTSPACDTICQQNLYNIRQINIAVGKDQDRVSRLWVTQKAIPAGVYIADPHGNIIFYYKNNENPENILKDLTKLLRISQIG